MKVHVRNLEKSLSKSLGALNKIKDSTICVGIKDKELALIALANELGSWNEKAQKMNPARPFLAKSLRGSSAKKIGNKIQNQLTKLIAMGWKEKGTERVLQDIADSVANQVRATIDSQNFVPNAESTIKKKHHSKILVGKTGDLYNSIEGWIE